MVLSLCAIVAYDFAFILASAQISIAIVLVLLMGMFRLEGLKRERMELN